MMRYTLCLDTETLINDSKIVITNNRDDKFTVDEAKEIINNGELADCNLSFRRLMENDFDVAETRQFYIDN